MARPVTHTAKRAALGVVIVLTVAAALWYAKTAIFLAFTGVLLAIVLHGTSSALSRMTGLPHLASLAIVVVAITGFFAAVFVGAGPTIAEQVTQLATSAATGVTNLSQQVLNAADKQKLLQDFDITKLLSQFSPRCERRHLGRGLGVRRHQRILDRAVLRRLFRRRGS